MANKHKDKDFALRFGTKVCMAREELGLTQTELASKLNMSQTFIALLESGASCIRFSNIEKLCEVLKKDADFFFPESERYAPKFTISDIRKIENSFNNIFATLDEIRKRIDKNKNT